MVSNVMLPPMQSAALVNGAPARNLHHSSARHHFAPRDNRTSIGRGSLQQHQQHHHSRHSHQRPARSYQKPTLNDDRAWQSWPEVRVRLTGYPAGLGAGTDAFDIYQILSKYGNVVNAHLEDTEGPPGIHLRVGHAVFNPPPVEAFWQRDSIASLRENPKCLVKAELQDHGELALKSNRASRQRYENVVICPIRRLDFGFMQDEKCLAVKRSVHAGLEEHGLRLTLNSDRRELTVYFNIDDNSLEDDLDASAMATHDQVSNSPTERDQTATHEYKFQIPFQQLHRIGLRSHDNLRFVELFITLPTSNVPCFYMKVEPGTTFDPGDTHWNINQAWHRQTSISSYAFRKSLGEKPLGLNQPEPFIDIGSWTVYRFCLDQECFTSDRGIQFQQALTAHGIELDDSIAPQVSMRGRNDPATSSSSVWQMLGDEDHSRPGHTPVLMGLSSGIRLTWPVRYQLEVCISKTILHPSNISEEFLTRLSQYKERDALRLLEHIADKNTRLFDPMILFSIRPPRTTSTQKIHPHHVLQRSVTIKPTSVEFMTPSVDQSNRIIRFYGNYSDHFIRVNFRGEKIEGKIFSSDDEVTNALFNRIKRCLDHGIQIGDRHFVWLASGNSQFREHGAYFYNPVPAISAEHIRREMGDLDSMHSVAKMNARMGQCFSTTREFSGVPQIIDIPDVKSGNICFTDGVGKISPFLTRFINTQMKFSQDTSAFQFRLGGAKGVLALWPDAKNQEIHIRPSQKKFERGRTRLEIIRPASFVRSELNRQLITNLVSLDVPEEVFVRKLDTMLGDINAAMSDPGKAIEELRKRIDGNGMTFTISDMVQSGFMREDDPFVRSILELWRAWAHKKLKDKAGIQIEDGAFVMGITDETRTLRGHYNGVSRWNLSGQAVPEIFLQVPDPKDATKFLVVKETCVLARNPSLHPGDIRVVQGVDVPRLRHFKNVVIFPQTGNVDIPSMCSGGDLDGDDYFVSWDQELVPPQEQWNHEAMKHTTATPDWVSKVTEEAIKNFFVMHIKQDSLGRIANGWLAQADQLKGGSKAEICKRLASLHSTAVDFPKTGVPASSKEFRRLQPRKYPHFLDNGRPAHKLYASKTVLGQLFDRVQRIEYQPTLHLPFDRRVLDSYPSDPNISEQALMLKNEYDAALRRIMAQFEVDTEAEIWTAFIMQHGKGLKEYELESKIGDLVGQQKERFREACIEQAGGREPSKLYPFVAAMYRVTAQQVKSELRQVMSTFGYESDSIPRMEPHERPMMSFPWLFHHELGEIAKLPAQALPPADAASTHHFSQARKHLSPRSADDLRNFQEFGGEGASPGMEDQLLPVARFLDSTPPRTANPATSSNSISTIQPQLNEDESLFRDFATLDFTITSRNSSPTVASNDYLSHYLTPSVSEWAPSMPEPNEVVASDVGKDSSSPTKAVGSLVADTQHASVVSDNAPTVSRDELKDEIKDEVEEEEGDVKHASPQNAFTRLARLTGG